MVKKHHNHEILTETQFFIQILKYVITFSYLLLLFMFRKISVKELSTDCVSHINDCFTKYVTRKNIVVVT